VPVDEQLQRQNSLFFVKSDEMEEMPEDAQFDTNSFASDDYD